MRSSRGNAIILAVGLFGVTAVSCGSSVEHHPSSSGSGGGTTSSSGTAGSAGALPDGGTAGSGGGQACGDEAMVAGFIVGTTVEPIHPTTDVDDYILNGTLSYQGAITQPIATNPAFDQEIQIDHGTGSPSVVQYFLPDGYSLPVTVNQPYTVTFRRRNGFESYAVGVVIIRPTSGLPPLLFVFEGGEYGRAFEDEDPVMAPLKVEQIVASHCPTEPFDPCNSTIYEDVLRFESTTGEPVGSMALYQGKSHLFPLLGDPFLMVNLSSTRIEPGCPDGPNGRASFLAINQAL